MSYKDIIDSDRERTLPFTLPVTYRERSTWTSRDVAPVISVSFGWAGREREL